MSKLSAFQEIFCKKKMWLHFEIMFSNNNSVTYIKRSQNQWRNKAYKVQERLNDMMINNLNSESYSGYTFEPQSGAKWCQIRNSQILGR